MQVKYVQLGLRVVLPDTTRAQDQYCSVIIVLNHRNPHDTVCIMHVQYEIRSAQDAPRRNTLTYSRPVLK